MGRWLQPSSFSSKFTLNVPPTFSPLTVSVNVRITFVTEARRSTPIS